MAGALETVIDSIRDATGFFFGRPVELTLGFARVAALGLGLQIAGIMLIMGFGLALSGMGPGDAFTLAFVFIAIVVAIAYFIVSTALSSTQYCIIEDIARGEGTGIIKKAKGLVPAFSRYAVVVVGALVLTFGTVLAGASLAGGEPIISGFLMLGGLCLMVALVFLIQFAIPDIALGNPDAYGALRSSYRTVAGNFWAVLLFDIAIVIAFLLTALVVSLPQGIVETAIYEAKEDAVVVFLAFSAYLALALAESVAFSLLIVIPVYFFRKRLAGEAPQPQPAAGPASEPPSKKRSARRRG
jgi:hypothetical protein